jgi:hypothetical protein
MNRDEEDHESLGWKMKEERIGGLHRLDSLGPATFITRTRSGAAWTVHVTLQPKIGWVRHCRSARFSPEGRALRTLLLCCRVILH